MASHRFLMNKVGLFLDVNISLYFQASIEKTGFDNSFHLQILRCLDGVGVLVQPESILYVLVPFDRDPHGAGIKYLKFDPLYLVLW